MTFWTGQGYGFDHVSGNDGDTNHRCTGFMQDDASTSPPYRRQTLIVDKERHMVVQPLSCRCKSTPTNLEQLFDTSMAPEIESGQEEDRFDRFVPSWIQKDGIVLRFKALSVGVQAHQGSDQQKFRILYHLSDSTYEVLYDNGERKGKVYLKRYCNTSSLQEWDMPNPFDLDIGKWLNLFGHTFKIIDMDVSTRTYLESQGRTITAPCFEDVPEHFHVPANANPPSKGHERLTAYLSRGENISKTITTKLPIEWKGVILKFWAVDDESTQYFIKYHPEDCSVELFEFLDTALTMTRKVLSRNNFIDQVGSLLKVTCMTEALYKPIDFLVGEPVKICGRNLIIHKADDASKAWMTTHLKDIDLSKLQDIPVASKISTVRKRRDRDVSDDDSEEVQPPPPGLDTMQFLAKFIGPSYGDRDVDDFNSQRKFIIRVNPADFSVSIKELNTPGSGTKFLERQKVYKDLAKKKGVLQPFQFYIGAFVEIYGRQYEILDADRLTLKYIADHPHYFREADATAILFEVRDALHRIPTSVPADVAFSSLQNSLSHASKAAIVSACMVLGQHSDKNSSYNDDLQHI